MVDSFDQSQGLSGVGCTFFGGKIAKKKGVLQCCRYSGIRPIPDVSCRWLRRKCWRRRRQRRWPPPKPPVSLSGWRSAGKFERKMSKKNKTKTNNKQTGDDRLAFEKSLVTLGDLVSDSESESEMEFRDTAPLVRPEAAAAAARLRVLGAGTSSCTNSNVQFKCFPALLKKKSATVNEVDVVLCVFRFWFSLVLHSFQPGLKPLSNTTAFLNWGSMDPQWGHGPPCEVADPGSKTLFTPVRPGVHGPPPQVGPWTPPPPPHPKWGRGPPVQKTLFTPVGSPKWIHGPPGGPRTPGSVGNF